MLFLNTQRAPRHAAPYVSLATLVEVMSCAVSFCAVSSQPLLVGIVLLDAHVVVVSVALLARIHLVVFGSVALLARIHLARFF